MCVDFAIWRRSRSIASFVKSSKLAGTKEEKKGGSTKREEAAGRFSRALQAAVPFPPEPQPSSSHLREIPKDNSGLRSPEGAYFSLVSRTSALARRLSPPSSSSLCVSRSCRLLHATSKKRPRFARLAKNAQPDICSRDR